jgi:hypothetical protein
MVLAAFTNGLGGNPGKHARYNLPTSLEDVIRVAVTVEQAEACQPKSIAFYVDTNTEEKERKKTNRGSARERKPNTANKTSRSDI